MILDLTTRAASDGCRRLLSGLFGDQLLGPIRHWSQLADAPWPAWPAEIRRRVGMWQRATVLGRALLYLVAGIETSRHRVGFALPGLRSVSARTSQRLLAGPQSFQLLRNVEGWAAHTGVEWSHPFLDQALVEFMLGQPPHARTQNGVSKVLLRAALIGILPDEVRNRQLWTSVDAAALRALPRDIEGLDRWAGRSLAVGQGLVSSRVAERLWMACRQQPSYRAVHRIAPLMGVEEWLCRSAVGVR
jgi:asparagine synthase (glutamine-hydrolysing)